MKRMTVKIGRLCVHIFLVGFGLTMLIPFLWMLSTAVKSPGEVFQKSSGWLPRQMEVRFDGKWVQADPLTRKPELCEIKYIEGIHKGEMEVVKDYRLQGSAERPWVWSLENDERIKCNVIKVRTIRPSSQKVLLADGRVCWVPQSDTRMKIKFRWSNFVNAWKQADLGSAYWNSLFVVICVTLGQLITSAMAGYAFSRLRFPGRDAIFLIYLGTLMIPGAVTMIPVFIVIKNLGWVDTFMALIIPPMFSAYGTFMLRQFFLGIPNELEEAAEIDGCHKVRIFWHVILPISKPALATLGIFTFIGNWRALLWPLIVINSPQRRTLPLALVAFQGEQGTDWTSLMAASLMSLVPIIIIFLIGQRFFVKGIQLGAVKG